MAVSMEMLRGPRCLTVRLTGVMESAFVRGTEKMFREHLEMCTRLGLAGLMYDVTGVDSRLGTLDIYDAAKNLASVQSAGVRIGVVARLDQVAPERFFERVALNRGALVKVFTDAQEAMGWLAGGPA